MKNNSVWNLFGLMEGHEQPNNPLGTGSVTILVCAYQ